MCLKIIELLEKKRAEMNKQELVKEDLKKIIDIRLKKGEV